MSLVELTSHWRRYRYFSESSTARWSYCTIHISWWLSRVRG